MADWTQLPNDLIVRIRSLLPLPDYFRITAVCRSWSSVAKEMRHAPASSQSPWLLLSDSEKPNTRILCDPIARKIYNINLPDLYGRTCSGASHGWILTISDEMDIHLCNPFSRARLQLPRIPPLYVGPIEFHGDPPVEYYLDDPDEYYLAEDRNCAMYKAIITADPATSDYMVMAILSGPHKLALWRPGNTSWIHIEEYFSSNQDVIWYQGKFYAITAQDIRTQPTFMVLDPRSDPPTVTKLTLKVKGKVINRWRGMLYMYLVDLMGTLVLVFRWMLECADMKKSHKMYTKGFQVFKVDLGRRRASCLDGIGDYALFLGPNESIAISALDFPGCKKNCIYFSGGIDDWPGIIGDVGIYSLADGSIESSSSNLFSQVKSASLRPLFGKTDDVVVLAPRFIGTFDLLLQPDRPLPSSWLGQSAS